MTNSNTHMGHGIVAGLMATLALSALMLLKSAAGLMPQLDPPRMISQMMGAQTPLVGWAVHFMIGTLAWGILFALLYRHLPGRPWLRGSIFATGAWLVMMLVMMPMAGAGMFGMGLGLGIMAPVATLMMHWLFGIVLGTVYAAQSRRRESAVSGASTLKR